MIEFQRVSRHYAKKIAVADLTLTVPPGELFALLGPNGAGKTTSIKMLVGLLIPSSGNVRVCGFDVVSNTQQSNACIGFVPDQPLLYEKLSGREFLEFVANMHGLERAQAKRRIAEEIEYFGLADFINDLAETYSHGMRQRVVFAAALLHDPPVLIVDEPMIGLDPRSMRLVKDMLKEKSRRGITIFMSTHTLAVAEEIADRIGIVDQGRLRFLGTLDELSKNLPARHGTLEEIYLQLTSADGLSPGASEDPDTVPSATSNQGIP